MSDVMEELFASARCDDCCAAPCVCEPNAKWINDAVRLAVGTVTFGLNERGDACVEWYGRDGQLRRASGNTAEDAINCARNTA